MPGMGAPAAGGRSHGGDMSGGVMRLYDPAKLNYWEIDDIESELGEVLELAAYADACHALGIKPVVDI